MFFLALYWLSKILASIFPDKLVKIFSDCRFIYLSEIFSEVLGLIKQISVKNLLELNCNSLLNVSGKWWRKWAIRLWAVYNDEVGMDTVINYIISCQVC